ncbi:LCP family protein [Candidatus Enterococcus murrayae]|uniref:LCP family protein n=1 Tax=Candidatus Enterococcus murrayae TaxID=2815321 RepID=A0ABS3HF13_9ENTE|nr:LCP family protein [Enterococcus sp. MJM16]MBO0452038.1 LCP family protein [Enterococcus sp. MJM16]
MTGNNNQYYDTNHVKKVLLSLLGIFLTIILVIAGFAAKMYYDVKSTANDTFEVADRNGNANKRKVNLSAQEPFSILLLGVDTGALGRTEQGRSDTMMVATVNPSSNESLLVSLPRDTYAEIVGHGTQDKINHAYAFGGAAMSMDTVEKLLDIPIDHYITINMQGIETLVDAVGGVEVNNSLDFTYDGKSFSKGKQELNGEEALKYSRMRYDDPNGDYGRQGRQRQIITGIAKKVLSTRGFTSYRSILETMGQNVKTDLTFSDMRTLMGDYRTAFGHVKSDQLKGEGFMQDGVSYQRIDSSELKRVQDELKTTMK